MSGMHRRVVNVGTTKATSSASTEDVADVTVSSRGWEVLTDSAVWTVVARVLSRPIAARHDQHPAPTGHGHAKLGHPAIRTAAVSSRFTRTRCSRHTRILHAVAHIGRVAAR